MSAYGNTSPGLSAMEWNSEDIYLLLEENYRLRRDLADLKKRLKWALETQPQGDRRAESAPISYVSEGLYQGTSSSSSEQRLFAHQLQHRQTSPDATGSIDDPPLLTGVTSSIAPGGSEVEVGVLPQGPDGPRERSFRNLFSTINQEMPTLCASQASEGQPGIRCQKFASSVMEPLDCSSQPLSEDFLDMTRKNTLPRQHLLHGIAVQLKPNVMGSKPMQASLQGQLLAGSTRSPLVQVTSTAASPNAPEDIAIPGQTSSPCIVKVQSLADVLPLSQPASVSVSAEEDATVMEISKPPELFQQPMADVSPTSMETDSGCAADDCASSSTMLYPTAETAKATQTADTHKESGNSDDKATGVTTTMKSLSKETYSTEALRKVSPKKARKALHWYEFRIKPHMLHCSLQDQIFTSESEDMVEISPGTGVEVAKSVLQSTTAQSSIYGMARVLLLHLFTIEELLNGSIKGRKGSVQRYKKPWLDLHKMAAIIDAIRTNFGLKLNTWIIIEKLRMALSYITSNVKKYKPVAAN
ncbi:uncharacterized protein [Diadema setosum]|uniref:uncharacterized protein n=1 Tax=Diadema setosum TaxID=31175 RepID=UPI003B3BC581